MAYMPEVNTVEKVMLTRAAAAQRPINGSLELLPLCNMNCDMCYIRLSRAEMEKIGRLYTADEWIRLGEEMAQSGVLFLLLTGGEPLMFPDFRRLYLELRQRGMILTVNTNGTLLDEEWAEFIGENKPRRINITLYGADDEAYRKLCHYPGGFEKALNAIRLLRERGVDVKINGSVTKENYKDMAAIYRIGQERHKIAAISRADLLTLRLDATNARNTLQNADIALKRAMFSLSSFLNMEKGTNIRLRLPSRPRELDIQVDQALSLARENNPDYLAMRQQVLEAEQEVDKTRKESWFNASLNASVGFNQVASNFRDVYKDPSRQDLVSISISIPLVDWGVRKGKHNIAKSNLNIAQISSRQQEVSLEEEVIITVSDFQVQQQLITSAEEALDIASMAYDETKQRFVIGKADISSLTLAWNRQQEAQRNYVTALQNYWLSYYKIRKLTLFDFETGLSLSNEFDYEHGL